MRILELAANKTRYVLSPTHLHEFKSADKTQSPVMSLYLPEQKLGSHSQVSGSSPKFILKGRQTGGVHRGHSWVFRAESYDTMMAWYEDIKALTEKTPQERSEFVRGHSRSFSRTSSRRSISSDGVVDEDDEEPYSAHNSAAAIGNGTGLQHQQDGSLPRRPSPGGRFPSDIEVNAQRGLQAPLSPSSMNDHVFHQSDQHYRQQQPVPNNNENDVIAAAGALPGSTFEQYYPRTGPENGYATAQGHQQVPGNNGTSNQAHMYHQQQSTAPYANHPAVLMAARQRMQQEEATHHLDPSHQEGAWMAGSPVEAASVPVGDEGRKRFQTQPQNMSMDGGLYVHASNGQTYHTGSSYVNYTEPTAVPAPTTTTMTTTSYRELPQTNHTTATASVPPFATHQTNGMATRPAMSERTESDAPTLSSEVPTISNLHVPGEYPKMNMI